MHWKYQNASVCVRPVNHEGTELAAASEKVAEWALLTSPTLIFKAETAEINGAHSGGPPWNSGRGWELTWCLMELRIRSIYQPDSLRDRPASTSTAHNGLPWINNNGRCWGGRGGAAADHTCSRSSVSRVTDGFWADEAFSLRKVTAAASAELMQERWVFHVQLSIFSPVLKWLLWIRSINYLMRPTRRVAAESLLSNPREWALSYRWLYYYIITVSLIFNQKLNEAKNNKATDGTTGTANYKVTETLKSRTGWTFSMLVLQLLKYD